MNPVFLRRLIGLVVLMALFFGLSWFLGEPAKRGHTNEQRVTMGVTPRVAPPEPATSETPIKPATPAPDLAAHAQAAAAAPATPAAAPPPAIAEHLSHPEEADSTESPEVAAAAAKPPVPLHKPHLKTATKLAHAPAPSAVPTPRLAPSPPLAGLAKAAPPGEPRPHPPAAPPRAPASSGNAWVQVGSFSQQTNATNVLAMLRHSGFHGEVSEINSGGARMFRVRLGPYASASDAAAVRQRLSGQGYPSARIVGP